MQEAVPPQQTEQQIATDLVRRIGGGDADAERELWQRYARGLLMMLTRRTGDPELAADLRQETYLVALEKLRGDGLAEPERLAAYLHGIARNLMIGDIRKKARRRTGPDTELVERCAADYEPSALEQLSRQQVAALTRQLLGELRVERDRELLSRYFVHDQDKGVICAELELDSVHFNRVLHRAKSRLRELVEKRQPHLVE